MNDRVFVGLGSNLDNPRQQLALAILALKQSPNLEVVRCSSFYETAPVGGPPQPDFINAVVELKTSLSPEALLDLLQMIEQQQGRVRTVKNGPRTLDLDLLLFGQVVMQTERLTLPHPRYHEREFVLKPLQEIAPDMK